MLYLNPKLLYIEMRSTAGWEKLVLPPSGCKSSTLFNISKTGFGMINFCVDVKVWNLKVVSFQQCQRLPTLVGSLFLRSKMTRLSVFVQARISLTEPKSPTGPKSGFCSRSGSY
jgi:hypothetical protein